MGPALPARHNPPSSHGQHNSPIGHRPSYSPPSHPPPTPPAPRLPSPRSNLLPLNPLQNSPASRSKTQKNPARPREAVNLLLPSSAPARRHGSAGGGRCGGGAGGGPGGADGAAGGPDVAGERGEVEGGGDVPRAQGVPPGRARAPPRAPAALPGAPLRAHGGRAPAPPHLPGVAGVRLPGALPRHAVLAPRAPPLRGVRDGALQVHLEEALRRRRRARVLPAAVQRVARPPHLPLQVHRLPILASGAAGVGAQHPSPAGLPSRRWLPQPPRPPPLRALAPVVRRCPRRGAQRRYQPHTVSPLCRRP